MVGLLFGWLVIRRVANCWIIGLLVCVVVSVAQLLDGWSAGCVIGQSNGQLVGWFIVRFSGQLVGWLLGWVVGCLVCFLSCCWGRVVWEHVG